MVGWLACFLSGLGWIVGYFDGLAGLNGWLVGCSVETFLKALQDSCFII